jgi:ubiquinone/menaquinone biosynthesis C-methylase UbiE
VGYYEERILPHLNDLALRSDHLTVLRQRACAGLHGEVLEIGFGSGRNVPHYPAAVTRVRAVDPATTGRRMAAERVAASPVPVEYVGLDGADLPLDDASVDAVLTTWTLCTIPDVERALAEVHRVLRPGGSLHFVEHGRSSDAGVRRWQHRLTPVQRRIFGGCHLARRMDELIRGAGFTIEHLDVGYAPGPKPYTYLYEGVARRA